MRKIILFILIATLSLALIPACTPLWQEGEIRVNTDTQATEYLTDGVDDKVDPKDEANAAQSVAISRINKFITQFNSRTNNKLLECKIEANDDGSYSVTAKDGRQLSIRLDPDNCVVLASPNSGTIEEKLEMAKTVFQMLQGDDFLPKEKAALAISIKQTISNLQAKMNKAWAEVTDDFVDAELPDYSALENEATDILLKIEALKNSFS